ncbi:CotH kinase family protein [Flavobacteriales bacterium]|nr:CotH kinase family protein [Flavobacteriales bacterium]
MRLIILIIVIVCNSINTNAQLYINEMMSLNNTAWATEQNNYPDWIELYNNISDSILLSDYFLSDDRQEIEQWQLPNRYIKGGGFFSVYASDLDMEMDCNFKISSKGEALFLSHKSVGLVDSLPAVSLDADQSFGRYPDGSHILAKLQNPTPNSPNDSIDLLYSSLSFSHAGGWHENSIDLSIVPSHSGAQIYYTINGAEPNTNDLLYTTDLTLKDVYEEDNIISEIPTSEQWQRPQGKVFKGHIIKSAAFENGQRISPVYTHSFFINPQLAKRYTFPIISLSTDPNNLFDPERGIYVKGQNTNYSQRGRAWERVAQFEYFDREGKRQINQTVGIRTNGNISRTFPQKSLLLYARNSYGKSRIKYPFFEGKEMDSFKRIILRCASSNDWKNTMFKNELAQRIVIDMNLEHPSTQEVIVFINGEYWGIHHLNERTDEHFISDYFDTDNIHLLTHNAQIEEGDNQDFLNLKSYMNENDMSLNEHYDYISSHIDIDNIIDYYCAQLFLANTDWPHNNVKYWKAQDGGKWRWLFFDCDECMSYEYYNLMADLINEQNTSQDFDEWSVFIIRQLFRNNNFREQFRRRFEILISSTFSTPNLMQHIKEMEKLYKAEVLEHQLRWNVPNNSNAWIEAVESLYAFASIRPFVMRQLLTDYLGKPFSLYPNPSKDYFQLEIHTDMQVENITILNTMGQSVYSYNGSCNKPIDIRHLSAGVYVVQVRFEERLYKEKLMIY